MRILYRLTLGFILISLLVGFEAYIGYSEVISIKNKYDQISDETLPVFANLNNIIFAGMKIVGATNEIIATSPDDKVIIDREKAEIVEGLEIYDSSFKEYEILVNKFFPVEKESLDAIDGHMQEIKNISSELISLKTQGIDDARFREKQNEFDRVEGNFLIDVDSALKQELREFEERSEIVQTNLEQMKSNSILFGFVSFAMAIILGLLISHRISQPIVKLKNASLNIGKGNLDSIIDIRTGDELEDLSKTFNTMTKDLKRSINETILAKNFSDNIILSMVDTLIVLNTDNTIKRANKALLDLLGYEENELNGKHAGIIFPEVLINKFANEKTIGKHSLIIPEMNYIRKDGSKIPIFFSASILIDNQGKIEGIVCLGKDITEQKIANEKIKASLNEKEVLLREIHHRVKNNMQIISSLLAHQMENISDNKIIGIFTESQNRIVSMSLVHEKLYQSGDLRNIDFKEYINDLGANLFQSYNINPGKIKLNINVDDISIDIDLAIPAGLIINELVTNSLKYAFPNSMKGEITIVLRSFGENMLELVIRDNGIGLPKDLDFRKTRSLGLHLVTILAEKQLQGTIDINSNNGAEFQIKFKGIK